MSVVGREKARFFLRLAIITGIFSGSLIIFLIESASEALRGAMLINMILTLLGSWEIIRKRKRKKREKGAGCEN